jgi:glycosyltransferase involved in cell wall biosynthesis
MLNHLTTYTAMNNPSILHAIDTTGPGGAEMVFLDLADKLNIEGYSNYAIIKGSGWVEEQLKKRGIRYYIVKPGGFLSIPYYWALFKLLRKNNTCLIQAHLLGSTLTYSILSFVTQIPLVATIHGQVDVNPNESCVWLKRKIMRAGVNQLIAVSRDLREYINRRKLFPISRVHVVYNGIDEKKYLVANSGRIRTQLGLVGDVVLIGSLGNVRPAKNYSFLIDIAAELTEKTALDVHFVIAGHQKEDLMLELNSKVCELGLHSKVHFIGFQDNTAEYLRQLDIFLLTSSSEGFSIATIEAMASELPVVATRCGGPEEILQNGLTGILINRDDLSQAVDSLQLLCSDIPKRQALGIAGKQYVVKNFCSIEMFMCYQRIYEKNLQQISVK